MRAAIYTEFQQPLTVKSVRDPVCRDDGVVIAVKACGICRSDWHGWMGNDPDISLPHVPGHEIAGIVEEVGAGVENFRPGDRVTLPFVCGCGTCPQCVTGNQQICDRQFQPGFTGWGGFAEYVAIDYADTNLVRLPDGLDFIAASSLGCRFITSFRAIKYQGRVEPDQWVAVWGCGGVGLAAIMIAQGLGARVVAIDIADEKLEFAKKIGASQVVNSLLVANPVEAIREVTGGGAHVSIDALGHPKVLTDSISSLRKHGKHIQVGIMEADSRMASVPINLVMGRELEIIGSHGMQAHRYPEVFEMMADGRLARGKLIGKTVSLEEGAIEITRMDSFSGAGVTVITV
jgi:alcohol dehydrogenase